MKKLLCLISILLSIWTMSGGGAISLVGEVNAQNTQVVSLEKIGEGIWQLSGTGTYETSIDLGTDMLVVDATRRVTGDYAEIVLTSEIIAGAYLQRDNYYGGSYAGGQNGIVTFQQQQEPTSQKMSASFTSLELGGHTTLRIGTDADHTASVAVSGKTLIGSSMTSLLYINSGSNFNANGEFQLNTRGTQGVLHINGTLNLNSSKENSIQLGYGSNFQYTSSVNLYRGGTLNALNSIVHCGYDGQLFFRISGGTANLYGLTFARNGDHLNATYGNVQKTLILYSGTLNLGAGGISILQEKDSYPFQLVSGSIGTIDDVNTTIAGVELAIGGGNTVFQPASGTITIQSNFADSTWERAGTGGLVQMNGAGTIDLAGKFNTTGGFQALAGTTVISGEFAGGKLDVNGGTVNITGTLSSQSGMTLTSGNVNLSGSATGGDLMVQGGTLTVIRNQNGISSSNAEIVVNKGSSLVLAASTDATAHTNFHNPITLNGGSLSTAAELSNRWRRLYAKLTFNADSTITCNTRLQLHSGLDGNGYVLTKDGMADLIFHSMGTTNLKKIIINNGKFCIEQNSNQALITQEGVYVNGGFLEFWGQSDVSANVFFQGGYFQSSGSNSNSTTSDSVFTLQQNTTFNNSGWEEFPAPFTMNGKIVANKGIVLNKIGNRIMTFAGNMDDFHGTIRLDTAETFLANGGNTAENPYNFNFNLNGGTFQINDAGTYHFEDVENLIQFSTASNANFVLGEATFQNHGTSSIRSTVAGATLTGTDGALNLGSAGDTLDFNIAENASLTVSAAVRTEGGAFTQSGTGTLEISNLYVDSGIFNLSDSAISAVTHGISVAPEASLTWDSPITLNDNVQLDIDGKVLITLTGEPANWGVHTLKLMGDDIRISPETIFLIQTDFSELSLEPLWSEEPLVLMETNADLSGMYFDVLFQDSLLPLGTTLYAIGDAAGNLYLQGRVPEPSTWILLIGGGLALLTTYRKRLSGACLSKT